MAKEPQLTLVKSLKDLTRDELENILETIRFRRMSAATAFIKGKNQKLAKDVDKIQQRVDRQYAMLEKELRSVDRAIEKFEKRLVEIETLKQSMGYITDQMITTGADDIMEDMDA